MELAQKAPDRIREIGDSILLEPFFVVQFFANRIMTDTTGQDVPGSDTPDCRGERSAGHDGP